MSYVLYGDVNSGSFAAEAALAEAGADVRLVTVSLDKDEQFEDAFRAINPMGRIPALVLPGGGLVTESAAILMAIAARHTQSGLLPDLATDEGALFLRWMSFLSNNIYGCVERIDFPGRFTSNWQEREAVKAYAQSEIRYYWQLVEKALPDRGPWALGERFCALDLYIANLANWDLTPEWRAPMCPKVTRIMTAVAARPKIAAIWARHFGASSQIGMTATS
jgi:GST-like protein